MEGGAGRRSHYRCGSAPAPEGSGDDSDTIASLDESDDQGAAQYQRGHIGHALAGGGGAANLAPHQAQVRPRLLCLAAIRRRGGGADGISCGPAGCAAARKWEN